MLNSYFLRNVSQFISTINENNPSIRILGFGYLDIDTIQLSNVWIHGQLDISILYVSGYLDTWILGYHGYLDTWIFGYFNFFSIRIMNSKKSLDIQVSGYPSIRISHPQLRMNNTAVMLFHPPFLGLRYFSWSYHLSSAGFLL